MTDNGPLTDLLFRAQSNLPTWRIRPGGSTMLFGNAPCSWGINYPTGNTVTWQQYLDEVAAAGYRGTELGPFGYLPADADVVRAELAKRGLTLIGATHVHIFGDRSTAPGADGDAARAGAPAGHLGARHLVIMDESAWYPPGREGVLDEAGWQGLVATVTRGAGDDRGRVRPEGDLPPAHRNGRGVRGPRSTGCWPRRISTSASTRATTPSGTRIRSPTCARSGTGSPMSI